MNFKKISVIGNACSGKTTLSRELAQKYHLPLIHVDSIQFLQGMKLRDPEQTRSMLEEISNKNEWIIDGFGPLKIIEKRFQKADIIIFIKFPLWRVYWWCIKRQFKSLFIQRTELPEHCFEATIPQTIRLFKTIWNVNFGMWPQLERIFQKEIYNKKIIYVHNLVDFKKIYYEGIKDFIS